MNLWKNPNNLATNIKLPIGLILLAFFAVAFLRRDSNHDSSRLSFDPSKPAPTSQTTHKAVSAESRKLLLQSAKNLAQAQPFISAAQLHANLFGQSIVADGQYCQAGQGGRSTRLEFNFGSQQQPQSIVQVCDQGFFYRIKKTGDQSELQTIDLRRVADIDQQMLFANQSTWMATGGLSSLITSLAENFDFESAETTTYRDTPVLKIRGQWKQEKLKRFLLGQTRYETIKGQIRWNHLRENIPEQCELLLGNDEYFPLFPYRIAFFRNQQIDGESAPLEIAALQLYELQVNADVPAEKFRVSFENVVRHQLTDTIVERIDHLNQIQRSARRPGRPTPK